MYGLTGFAPIVLMWGPTGMTPKVAQELSHVASSFHVRPAKCASAETDRLVTRSFKIDPNDHEYPLSMMTPTVLA